MERIYEEGVRNPLRWMVGAMVKTAEGPLLAGPHSGETLSRWVFPEDLAGAGSRAARKWNRNARSRSLTGGELHGHQQARGGVLKVRLGIVPFAVKPKVALGLRDMEGGRVGAPASDT